MQDSYFSERELGAPARDQEVIGQHFWDGFTALIRARVGDGSLAESFPLNCPDAPTPFGCDESAVKQAFSGDVPSGEWPIDSTAVPETLAALDAVEFFCRHVSKPREREWHPFFSHNHILSFDRQGGRTEYVRDVNRLFRRNTLAYELSADGEVHRLAPAVLRDTLKTAIFQTGDDELDRILEVARSKFGEPDVNLRREAVEKLWDAWERLKTIEPGADKKIQIQALLAKAIPEPKFRECVSQEAAALTSLGNDFLIRHTETNKTPITDSEFLDYLFHRLFSLILMLLRRTRRTR